MFRNCSLENPREIIHNCSKTPRADEFSHTASVSQYLALLQVNLRSELLGQCWPNASVVGSTLTQLWAINLWELQPEKRSESPGPRLQPELQCTNRSVIVRNTDRDIGETDQNYRCEKWEIWSPMMYVFVHLDMKGVIRHFAKWQITLIYPRGRFVSCRWICATLLHVTDYLLYM